VRRFLRPMWSGDISRNYDPSSFISIEQRLSFTLFPVRVPFYGLTPSLSPNVVSPPPSYIDSESNGISRLSSCLSQGLWANGVLQ
jgi:hypothetical protein